MALTLLCYDTPVKLTSLMLIHLGFSYFSRYARSSIHSWGSFLSDTSIHTHVHCIHPCSFGRIFVRYSCSALHKKVGGAESIYLSIS